MNDTTLFHGLSLPQQALVFDLEALYACLQSIPDHRDPRGLQYPLATLLMIGVLAKLAGQVSLRGMADWAKLRSRELASALPSEAREDVALQYLEPGPGSRSGAI